MAGIIQPVGQKRLTNIAIVRYKARGKRFELACYKNKVMNWRSGLEKDIDEVLQTHEVFSNVSRGIFANKKDLYSAFRTEDEEKIISIILQKGELQVSERERKVTQENKFRDIATIVAQKCVNPQTKRPYSLAMIETAMKDELHYSVAVNRSAKQQALDVIRDLSQFIPIARAEMRIRIVCNTKVGKELKRKVCEILSTVESEDWGGGGSFELTGLIDPGNYRTVDEITSALTRGQGRVEVEEWCVQTLGDEKL